MFPILASNNLDAMSTIILTITNIVKIVKK